MKMKRSRMKQLILVPIEDFNFLVDLYYQQPRAITFEAIQIEKRIEKIANTRYNLDGSSYTMFLIDVLKCL